MRKRVGPEPSMIVISKSEIQSLVLKEVHRAVKLTETKMESLLEKVKKLECEPKNDFNIRNLEAHIKKVKRREDASMAYVRMLGLSATQTNNTQNQRVALSSAVVSGTVDLSRLDSVEDLVESTTPSLKTKKRKSMSTEMEVEPPTAESGRKRPRVQRSPPPTPKRPSIVIKKEEETSPVTVKAENTQREIQAEPPMSPERTISTPSPAQSGHSSGTSTPPAPTASRYTAIHMTLAGNNNKTGHMTRYQMGGYLRARRLLPVDLRRPVAFNPPPAYAVLIKFLKSFNLEQQTMSVLTKHKSFLSVVQEREPVSQVRGLTAGEPPTVWRNVTHPALLNRHRDLSWMAAHEVLPVAAVMHSRGLAGTSRCPRSTCGGEETVRHLLWECPFALDLWREAGPLVSPCLPAGEVLNEQMVLYGVSRSEIPKEQFRRLWLTLTCIKEAIWTSRNLLVGKRVETAPRAAVKAAAVTLGWYVPRDIRVRGPPPHMKRTGRTGPRPHSEWCQNNWEGAGLPLSCRRTVCEAGS